MAPAQHVVRGAAGTEVHTAFTDRLDGDLRVELPADVVEPIRSTLAPTPWTWLRQEHGAAVVVVEHPGQHAGATADAAVTSTPGATLAVHTADCAGVLLHGSGGDVDVIGAAHAGWRGLVEGVLGATVERMRDLGAERITWRLGPCISPASYEFGDVDLARVVAATGPAAAATTADGTPALDLRAGVALALAAVGAEPIDPPGTEVPCTAGDDRWYSWRARRDTGRQAAVIWMERP